MSFVLDASIAMSWCFADEADDSTDALLDRVGEEGAIVPALWTLEVSNVLALAERRGRISEAQTVRFATLLRALPIEIAATNPEIDDLIGAVRRNGLTAYDASYLLLAERSGLPLATRDKSLRRAAASAGVAVL